jgi:hypothetical protein
MMLLDEISADVVAIRPSAQISNIRGTRMDACVAYVVFLQPRIPCGATFATKMLTAGMKL